jgi:N-methylhydantoinase B
MIREQIDYDRLVSIARELDEVVARTTRSQALAEAHRFAVAVLTADLRLAIQLQSDMGESYLIRASSRALVDYFAYDLAEGDLLVTGDPFRGGSTPHVLTFLAPVFVNGDLVLLVAIRAQMIDLAGDMPGPLNALATETWQEAMRLSPLKLYRNGVLQRDFMRFIERNSRASAILRSDIDAIVAALRGATTKLADLITTSGPQRIIAAIDAQIAATRQQALAATTAIAPAATATTIYWPALAPITLAASIERHADHLALDFTGTSPQVQAPINIGLDHARGFVLAAIFAEELDRLPLNDGMLESVTLTAPQATLVNPQLPAATGLSYAYTGHALTALVRHGLLHKDAASALHGPAPTLTLFAPIGSAEQLTPLTLEPGFAPGASGWTAPVLAGRRVLPSAEELERQHGLRLIARERDDDGRLVARLQLIDQPCEAAGFAPPGSDASIILHTDGAEHDLARANAVPVPKNAQIVFTYPSLEALAHVQP